MEKNSIEYIPDFMIGIVVLEKNPGMNFYELHKATNITYSHLQNLKKYYIEKEFIEIKKLSKKHIPTITDKGKMFVYIINSLLEKLDIEYNDVLSYRRKKGRVAKQKLEDIEDGRHENVSEEIPNKEEEVVERDSGIDIRENRDNQEN